MNNLLCNLGLHQYILKDEDFDIGNCHVGRTVRYCTNDNCQKKVPFVAIIYGPKVQDRVRII